MSERYKVEKSVISPKLIVRDTKTRDGFYSGEETAEGFCYCLNLIDDLFQEIRKIANELKIKVKSEKHE